MRLTRSPLRCPVNDLINARGQFLIATIDR